MNMIHTRPILTNISGAWHKFQHSCSNLQWVPNQTRLRLQLCLQSQKMYPGIMASPKPKKMSACGAKGEEEEEEEAIEFHSSLNYTRVYVVHLIKNAATAVRVEIFVLSARIFMLYRFFSQGIYCSSLIRHQFDLMYDTTAARYVLLIDGSFICSLVQRSSYCATSKEYSH